MTTQVQAERANGSAADVVAAYRAGLTVEEVAQVFCMRPTLVAQLVAAAQIVRPQHRRSLRLFVAR